MRLTFNQQAPLALVLGFATWRASASGFNSSDNLAVYWGQNSYGAANGALEQQTLATYCANTSVNIIPMAFLVQMTTGPGTELINCPQIGADIKTCQQKYNKTILISIGGATYTEGGFASEDAAVSTANQIWGMFGPAANSSSNATDAATVPTKAGNSTSVSTSTASSSSITKSQIHIRDAPVLRPFGDAVIDGFDFDFETTVQNVVPFANQLRSLMKADTSKHYYLTAAPQCPYPDAADNTMLNGNVTFDAVFVQFYNNYCGVQNYAAGSATQNNFNFDIWDAWAKNGSANSNVKVFLGVPAGQTAAGSGYESANELSAVIEYSKNFSSFGGVMMWDMSQACANAGFLDGVKTALSPVSTKDRRVRRSLSQRWRA